MHPHATTLPGLLGIEVTHTAAGEFHAHFVIQPHHMAPNGFLHAGSVVSLADTCCG